MIKKVFLFPVKTVCVKKRRCWPSIRNGKVGEGKEPSHKGTEEDPQRGSVKVQQPPCTERQVPVADAAWQGRLQRSSQGKSLCHSSLSDPV